MKGETGDRHNIAVHELGHMACIGLEEVTLEFDDATLDRSVAAELAVDQLLTASRLYGLSKWPVVYCGENLTQQVAEPASGGRREPASA